jgi:hypothetical protein
MRFISSRLQFLPLVAFALAGCLGTEAGDQRGGLGTGASGANDVMDDGDSDGRLDCPRGGPVGDIEVEFDCDCVTVWSCKDLSNVVVEAADRDHEKTEGLSDTQGTFCSSDGQPIKRAWVKAGNNASGDGPGYGERFDAPGGTCIDDEKDAGTPEPEPKDAGVPDISLY